MKEQINKYWIELKTGTKKMFKEFFNKETNKKQRANMWTFSRLIIPIITIITSILGLLTNTIGLLITSSIFAGFGAVTDYFDGKSSRKHNSSSEYGKKLDQITDKVFSGLIGINLLFINPNYIIILIGELLIASTNIFYKVKNKDLNICSTKIGKIKQFPLFISLSLGYLSNINSILFVISNISILLTALMQLATTNSYIINNNKEIKKTNKKKVIINKTDISNDEDIKQEEKSKTINNNKKIEKIKEKKKLYEDMKQLLQELETENIEEYNYVNKKSKN